jgi:hypothetical protein
MLWANKDSGTTQLKHLGEHRKHLIQLITHLLSSYSSKYISRKMARARPEASDRQLASCTRPMASSYRNLYHHASNAKLSISHRFFRMKNMQDTGLDNVFFGINPVEKCTRSFPRCYSRRRNVTSWRILGTTLAAPSIIKQVIHYGIHQRLYPRLGAVHSKLNLILNERKYNLGWHDTCKIKFAFPLI